jgi:hypothetical protein
MKRKPQVMVEFVFSKSIDHYEEFDWLTESLNKLVGSQLSWEFGSGCSAIEDFPEEDFPKLQKLTGKKIDGGYGKLTIKEVRLVP